jgi:hypothetical protein
MVTTSERGARSARIRRAVAAAVLAVAGALVGLSAPIFARPALAQDVALDDVPMPRLAPAKATPAAAQTAQATDSGDDSGDSATDGDVAPDGTDATEPNGTDDIEGGSGDDLDGIVAPDTADQPPDAGPPKDIRPGLFTLEARLAKDDPPLGDGVKWRIFGDTPDQTGHLPVLGEADGGVIYIRLDQGTYFVHAAYGRAGATRKIDVNSPTGGEVVVLNAGGVRLLAVNGKDEPLNTGDVTFDVYAPDEGGADERFLLIPNAPPGHVLSLNAGTYHVVCKYGDANAIVRTDIKIEPGKLTEATIFQKAARLTLKLVEQHGGEALADTAWTVLTQKGERVVESVGAFPSVVLAAGDYTARARHDDKIFQANFSVEAGVNHDVEVLAE